MSTSKDDVYGAVPPPDLHDEIEEHVEELSLLGYSVMQNVLSVERLAEWRERIDRAYSVQLEEFGEEKLARINELDICRAVLLEDAAFIDMAMQQRVLAVVERTLGEYFILNLQNAIINRPSRKHHQSSWHRDLPYQNWVISKPLAIGALFAIDEFSETTGGTRFLPSSHRHDSLPSSTWIKNHAITVSAPAGSVILFDAMIFHSAGHNVSTIIRRGVNHLYTVPIIKQQYDLPRALGDGFSAEPRVMNILGFNSQVPINATDWRRARAKRMNTQI